MRVTRLVCSAPAASWSTTRPANADATARRTRTKSFIRQNGWSASCCTDETGSLRTLCAIGRIPRG